MILNLQHVCIVQYLPNALVALASCESGCSYIKSEVATDIGSSYRQKAMHRDINSLSTQRFELLQRKELYKYLLSSVFFLIGTYRYILKICRVHFGISTFHASNTIWRRQIRYCWLNWIQLFSIQDLHTTIFKISK